ncbi:MAG: sugar phosphate isomerase/epimerase [Clostridiaceae bacterium]|nr:sugar phosphate isomerase/epimerase [Clostridiaceae bacterium]
MNYYPDIPRGELLIAAQMYTIREQIKTPDEIWRALVKLKEIGYTAIQVSGMGEIDPQLFAEYTEELGLRVVVTHVNPNLLLENPNAIIEQHKLWNCPIVGIGGAWQWLGQPGVRYTTTDYDSVCEMLNRVGETLRAAGLGFAYHNHHFEFRRLPNGQSGMEYILERVPAENMALIADLYWLQVAGVLVEQFIREHHERIALVHFKDLLIDDNNQQIFTEIGQGNMDYRLLASLCKEYGIKVAAVEQDICRRDPMESLAMSYDYLQSLEE